MKRITENYDDHTKEELLAECVARGIEGVNSSTLKADIVAALELSDEQNQESKTEEPAPHATPPLVSPEALNIPQVKNIPDVVDASSPSYKDKDFTGGLFKMRNYVSRVNSEGREVRETTLYPGESFALCQHDPDVYGRTHSLKNSLHFWEGSESQFQMYFEKE